MHIAGGGNRRQAVGTGDGECRAPGAVQNQFDRVLCCWLHKHKFAVVAAATVPRETLPHRFAQNDSGLFGLFNTLMGNGTIEHTRFDHAGARIIDAVEQLPRHPKRRRHHATGIARMHTFSEHIDRERAVDQATQRGSDPQLIVIARAGIERDHQLHVAHARGECIEIKRQIITAAFLTGFDQADTARPRHTLIVQRDNGGERGEYRVAVIGAATAIQLAVLKQWCPRPKVGAPAGHLRLFVEVAVEQDGLVVAAFSGGRNVKKQHGCAIALAYHFHGQPRDILRGNPGARLLDGGIQKTMFGPVRVKARRLGRQLDVFDELRNNFAVPLGINIGNQLVVVDGNIGYGVACGHDGLSVGGGRTVWQALEFRQCALI